MSENQKNIEDQIRSVASIIPKNFQSNQKIPKKIYGRKIIHHFQTAPIIPKNFTKLEHIITNNSKQTKIFLVFLE